MSEQRTIDEKLDAELLEAINELYKKLSDNQRELPEDMKCLLYENRARLYRK